MHIHGPHELKAQQGDLGGVCEDEGLEVLLINLAQGPSGQCPQCFLEVTIVFGESSPHLIPEANPTHQ